MKKVLYSLPVMLVLCFAFSLSAFAAGTDLFPSCGLNAAWYYDADADRIDLPITNLGNGAYKTATGIDFNNDGSLTFNGFGFTLGFPGMVRVDPGKYFVVEFRMFDQLNSPDTYDETLVIFATDSNGIAHSLEYTYEYNETDRNWYVTAAGQVGDGNNAETLLLYSLTVYAPLLESNMAGSRGYNINCHVYVSTHETLMQQNHEELLNKIDEAASKITNEDFGYETPENVGEAPGKLEQANAWVTQLHDYWNTFLDQFYVYEDVVFSQDNSAYSFLWCWFIDSGFIFTGLLLCCFFLIMRKIVL